MLVTLLILCCCILLLFLVDSIRFGITPTPTSKKVQIAMKQLLPELKGGQILDCGSGFGTLAVFLKKNYPSVKVKGYEGSWIPYWISKLISKLSYRKEVLFLRRNFLNEDLKDYSLLVCYLYPKISPKLAHKFKKELKPGTWVISHTFAIQGLHLIQSIRANDLYKTPIYLYQIMEA